jgi:plastocyanin
MDNRIFPVTTAPTVPLRRALVMALCMWLATAGILATLAVGPAARGATHTVDIAGFAFSPSTLTIAVGDTVTWTNSHSEAHTATASGGAFDSGTLNPGQSFSFTFTAAGSFPYVCNFHPEMTGTITVQAAAAGSPTPTQAAAASPAATTAATQVPNTSTDPVGAGGRAADASGVLALAGALLVASAIWLRVAARRRRVA